MADIIRNMTKDELQNLTVDGVKGVNLNKPKRKKNAREKFEDELRKQEQQCTMNGLPFARHIARAEFNQGIKSQVDKQLQEYGSIERPEDLKLPQIDWSRYSDLSNFEVLNEKEVPDTNLSNKNPGLNVKINTVTYKFKGYAQTYKVMESGPSAITRAVKTRALLDKSINEEINTKKK